tara:strand:+ start:2540 stop:4642 length:2103 start_codon:yes stop_codon:yes gene_type:complete
MSFAVGLMKSLAKGIDERSARRKKIIDEQMLLAKTKGVSARNKMKATAQSYKDMITQIKGNVNGQLSDSYLLALASGKGGADLKTVHGLVTSRAANGKTQRYTAEDLNAMINLNSYALPKGMDLNKGLEQLAGLQQKREETDTSKPSDSKFGKNLLLAGFQIDPQQNAETYLKKAHYDGLPVNELIQGIGFSGKGKIEGMGVVQTDKGLSALAGGDTIASVYSNQKYFTSNVATKFSSEVDGFSNQGGYFSAVMSTKDGTLKGDAKIALKSKVEELAFKASDVYTSLSREIGDRQALALVNQALGDSSISAEEAFSNLKKLSDDNNLPVNFSSDVIVPKEGEEEQLGFKTGEVGESDLNKEQANVKTVTNSKLSIPIEKPEMESQVIEVARELEVDLTTLSVETINKINSEISKITTNKIPEPKLDVIKGFIKQDNSSPTVTKINKKSTSKPEVFTETPELTRDAEGYQEYYESRIKGEGLFYNKNFLKKQTDKDTKINLKDLDDDMKDRLVDGAPSPLLKVLKDKFTELDTGNIGTTKLEDKPVAKKIKKKIEDSETKLNRIAEGYQEYYESRIKGEGLFYNKDFLKKQTDKDTKTLDDTLKDATLALDRAKALESNANETQRQLNILDKLMDKLDKLLGFDKVNTKEAYDSFYTNRPDLRAIAVDPDVEKQKGLMSRKINNKLLLDRMQTIQRQDNNR